MIFLVKLHCPAGHMNAGTPVQYASDKPPVAWLEQVTVDFWKAIKHHEAGFARCPDCDCELGPHWKVTIVGTSATSIAELVEWLESRPLAMVRQVAEKPKQ